MFNKTVDKWNKSEKKELLNIIKQYWNQPYLDVQVVGSFCFGGFTDKSDVDVIIIVDEKPEYRKALIRQIQDRILHIVIRGKPNNSKKHKYNQWDLPVFSLVTNEIIPGNQEQTDIFRKRQKCITITEYRKQIER